MSSILRFEGPIIIKSGHTAASVPRLTTPRPKSTKVLISRTRNLLINSTAPGCVGILARAVSEGPSESSPSECLKTRKEIRVSEGPSESDSGTARNSESRHGHRRHPGPPTARLERSTLTRAGHRYSAFGLGYLASDCTL